MREFEQTMYVIIDHEKEAMPYTICYSRKYCIDNFLQGTSINWDEAKKIGWSIKKVIVNIKPID